MVRLEEAGIVKLLTPADRPNWMDPEPSIVVDPVGVEMLPGIVMTPLFVLFAIIEESSNSMVLPAEMVVPLTVAGPETLINPVASVVSVPPIIDPTFNTAPFVAVMRPLLVTAGPSNIVEEPDAPIAPLLVMVPANCALPVIDTV